MTDRIKRLGKEGALAFNNANKMLEAILSKVPVGIVIISIEHEVLWLNQAALIMAEIDSENDIIGKTCHKHLCPTEYGKCPVLDLGLELDHSERTLLTASGKLIPILKNVLKTTLDGLPVLIEAFVDISEQKRLETRKLANKGKNLASSSGAEWQICARKGIKNFNEIQKVPANEWKPIEVPGKFESVLGEVDGEYWYKINLFLNPGDCLYFDGVDDDAEVYANGRLLVRNRGFNVPFAAFIPFSMLSEPGEVSLYLKAIDYGGYGGITGNVFLVSGKNSKLTPIEPAQESCHDRIYWGLWGDFLTQYQIEGCKRFIAWLREGTNKPVLDRSRGSTFDAYVPYAEMSELVDAFGPHVSPSLALDYAEGLNRSPGLYNSEYYANGHGEKDPVASSSPDPGRFWGAFYRRHPRSAYREAGLAGFRFWETVARGFSGIQLFSPLAMRWNTAATRTPGCRKSDQLSFYPLYEPRTGSAMASGCAWIYKNIYPCIRNSKADHKLFFFVSQGSIKQSQLGPVNDQHPLKMNNRALYQMITKDLGEQAGFVDAQTIANDWKNTGQDGRVIFIAQGEFIDASALSILCDFVKRGGTVVAFGPLGLWDAYGRWMAKDWAQLTGAHQAYRTQGARLNFVGDKKKLTVKTCFAFDLSGKNEPLIKADLNDKTVVVAYRRPLGKGEFYQIGLIPREVKLPKGFDNVDEAFMNAEQKQARSTSRELEGETRELLKKILDKANAVGEFKATGKNAKVFVRNDSQGRKLIFLTNTDFLEANDIGVTFNGVWTVELLNDMGAKSLGKLQDWSGSVSPGGCRIFRLSSANR